MAVTIGGVNWTQLDSGTWRRESEGGGTLGADGRYHAQSGQVIDNDGTVSGFPGAPTVFTGDPSAMLYPTTPGGWLQHNIRPFLDYVEKQVAAGATTGLAAGNAPLFPLREDVRSINERAAHGREQMPVTWLSQGTRDALGVDNSPFHKDFGVFADDSALFVKTRSSAGSRWTRVPLDQPLQSIYESWKAERTREFQKQNPIP